MNFQYHHSINHRTDKNNSVEEINDIPLNELDFKELFKKYEYNINNRDAKIFIIIGRPIIKFTIMETKHAIIPTKQIILNNLCSNDIELSATFNFFKILFTHIIKVFYKPKKNSNGKCNLSAQYCSL
ncbi:MAG: hypothetical protein U0354_02890 [Candidatus Sericytochromatia bacterium]